MYETGDYSDRIPAIMDAHLKEKGYVTPLDVLLEMDILSDRIIRLWRDGRIPYLEKLCRCSFSDISDVLREMRGHAANLRLVPSWSCYKSQSHPETGQRHRLWFSKNRIPRLEQQYATHYLDLHRLRKLKAMPRQLCNPCVTQLAVQDCVTPVSRSQQHNTP